MYLILSIVFFIIFILSIVFLIVSLCENIPNVSLTSLIICIISCALFIYFDSKDTEENYQTIINGNFTKQEIELIKECKNGYSNDTKDSSKCYLTPYLKVLFSIDESRTKESKDYRSRDGVFIDEREIFSRVDFKRSIELTDDKERLKKRTIGDLYAFKYKSKMYDYGVFYNPIYNIPYTESDFNKSDKIDIKRESPEKITDDYFIITKVYDDLNRTCKFKFDKDIYTKLSHKEAVKYLSYIISCEKE